MSRPARYLLGAQVGFVAFLLLCVAIDPRGLGANHGWSYYEGRAETLVPYILAFVVFAAPVLYAAALLERSAAPAGFAIGLRYLCFFLLLNLATPDTVNAFFYWAHDVTSALLFVYELGFAAWLAVVVAPRALVLVLLGVQFAGGLVAMFSQLHVIPYLGEGILLFQLSFALVLIVAAAPIEVFEGELEEARVAANR